MMKYKSTQQLAVLRDRVGISQQEAAHYFDMSDYNSVGKWEGGHSKPRSVRRLDFMHYLWDELRLRQTPDEFYDVWQTIMVEQWRWMPLSTDEQRQFSNRAVFSQLHVTPSVTDPPISQAIDNIRPPLEPDAPPYITNFVGRTKEIEVYARSLRHENMAVIVGMTGVGKTVLAAELAYHVSEKPENIFWYQCHINTDFRSVLWKLAGFLYAHHDHTLWQMIYGMHSETPERELIDRAVQVASGRNFLLCFDDFQYTDADQGIQQLIDKLRSAAAEGQLSLMIVSQNRPSFVQVVNTPTLDGLSFTDTKALLNEHELVLSDSLFTDLYQQTEGNAQFLILAINALKAGESPEKFMRDLSESDDMERYLVTAVDKILSEDERAVMEALATLKYQSSREAIEAVLGNDYPGKRIFIDLTEQHLLTKLSSHSAVEYVQHTMIQAFYENMISSSKKRSYHHLAGQHYAERPFHQARAAYHFQQAGKIHDAAKLVTQDIWGAINRYETKLLRTILTSIEKTAFAQTTSEQLLWSHVQIALGQVMRLLGERETAHQGYQEALAIIETLLETDTQLESSLKTSYVNVSYELAYLLENDAPNEAFSWLEKGLAKIADSPIHRLEKAKLYLRLGSVQIVLADLDKAQEALHKALSLLPENEHQLSVAILTNLGGTYWMKGDIQQCIQYTQQGLNTSRKTGNRYQTLGIQSNLAITKEFEGQWDDAIQDCHDCLTLAEQMNAVANQAIIAGLVGQIYTKRGDMDLAKQNLQNALALARKHQLNEELAGALSAMTMLELCQKTPDYTRATTLLDEARMLATEAGFEYHQPELAYVQATLSFSQNRYDEAMNHAKACFQTADEFGMTNEQGKGLAMQGRILSTVEKYDEAIDYFKQSLSLLEEQYEVGRTNIYLGAAYRHIGEIGLSKQFWQTAEEMLAALGAKPDLFILHKIRNHTQA